MVSFKAQVVLSLLAISLVICLAEAAPSPLFEWLLGVRSGRSRRVQSHGQREQTYGDICRAINPSPWTPDGFAEPNCPP